MAAAIAYRIAFGSRAGLKVMTVRVRYRAKAQRASPFAPTSTGSACMPQGRAGAAHPAELSGLPGACRA